MYSEQDRTLIRRFLGFSAIFLQADSRLEVAIGATQSIADGGARPDSNTENFIKGLIYGTAQQPGGAVTQGPVAQNITFAMPAEVGLLAIKQAIDGLIPIAFVISADKMDANIDPGRAMKILRGLGREKVTQMCTMLATERRKDIFDEGGENPKGDTFYNLPDGRGSNYRW
jgi:hypothetical protein